MNYGELLKSVLPERLAKLVTDGDFGFSAGLMVLAFGLHQWWPQIAERSLSWDKAGVLVVAACAVITPVVKGVKKGCRKLMEKSNE